MHDYLPLIYLLPILLLLYLVFTRSRRAQRAQTAVLDAVRPGARVMTTSGLHATVTSIEDDDTVVLEIAPGVQTRWVKLAIGQVFAEHDQDSGARPVDDRIDLDRVDTDRDDRTLT